MFHVERSTRVVGPPGTGKTHTLLRLAQEAVEKHGRERVIVASYTRKAAAEISARGGGSMPDHVGTVHALALRALRAAGHQDRVLEDWRGKATFLEGSPQWAERLDELLGALGAARAARTPARQWPPLLQEFARDWLLYLREEDGVDFHGIIELAIREEALPHEAPAVVFHDEAQDSTALERRYLELMADRGAILVEFGDPLQTLYQFRGACPRAFSERLVDAEHLLEQSYRVPGRVLRLAVAFMADHGCRVPDYRPRPAEGLTRSLRGNPANPGPDFVDRVIETADSLGSMMVLSPTRQGVRGLLDALQARGYPYGSQAHDGRPWSPLRDKLAPRVADYVAPELEGRPRWGWGELRSWTRISPKRLLAPGGEDRLENQQHLGAPSDFALREILSPAAYSARSVDELLAAAGLPGNQRRLGVYHELVARTHGLGYLRGTAPTLAVHTIHAAKGGEADAVWIADSFGRRFGSEMRTSRGWEAVRNMAYVAITRARHELTLLDAGRHSLGLARYAPVS